MPVELGLYKKALKYQGLKSLMRRNSQLVTTPRTGLLRCVAHTLRGLESKRGRWERGKHLRRARALKLGVTVVTPYSQ